MLESDCRPGSRCFRASRTGRARLWSCLAGALAIALHVPGAEVQAAEADGFPPAAESIQEPGASSGIGAAQVSEADSAAARNPPSVGGPEASPVLRMRGFVVEGVGLTPYEGITPVTMSPLAHPGHARVSTVN